MVDPKHEIAHSLPEQTGAHQPLLEPQVVTGFPANPTEGAVYFTPTMAGRKTKEWTELPYSQKETQLDRRIELYQAVGTATGNHIAALKAENNTVQAEKEEAARQAVTDELTGLKNRRGLMQELEKAILETVGDPDPRIDLLFIDLDKFKQLNDTQGHVRGDRLLKEVSALFEEILTVRQGDIVARIGGDEFVVLLRSKMQGNSRRQERTEDEAIEGFSLRVQDIVSQVAEAMNSSVTASVGVVKYLPNESAEEFLDRGDKAMYAAKEAKGEQR